MVVSVRAGHMELSTVVGDHLGKSSEPIVCLPLPPAYEPSLDVEGSQSAFRLWDNGLSDPWASGWLGVVPPWNHEGNRRWLARQGYDDVSCRSLACCKLINPSIARVGGPSANWEDLWPGSGRPVW